MRITTTLLLALSFLLSSCGGYSPKADLQKMVSLYEELAEVLHEVDDKESAREAVDRLEEIQSEMKAIQGRMEKFMTELGEDELKEWQEKFPEDDGLEEEGEKAVSRVRREMVGLLEATDYGKKELKEAFDLFREFL